MAHIYADVLPTMTDREIEVTYEMRALYDPFLRPSTTHDMRQSYSTYTVFSIRVCVCLELELAICMIVLLCCATRARDC